MSKYTTELRYICEKYAGLDESVGYNSTRATIEAARSHIFEDDYPIFDEGYRSVLETKILRHFYTREIAAESVGLWKMWLNTRMNEIMPYYNQRYESEFIRFNPLYDTDLATSRDDKFGSQRVDVNSNDIVNGGNDIVNTHNDKNVANSGSDVGTLGGRDIDTLSGRDVDTLSGRDVDTLSGRDVDTLSGTDSVVQTGSISDAKTGYDNTAYDDRDSSDDDRTVENWKNSNTTDWHYASDTPQSTISQISDSNYATSFTKDTHIQTNTLDGSGDLNAPNDNYEKTHDKVEHNNHNDTRVTFNDTTTETFNSKTDATTYGKVDTMAYGKVDTTDYGKVDTMAYGKVDTTDYGKTDTQVYGKITDTEFDEQQATTYGKTTHGEVNNNRGFHSTDEWLEHIVGKRNNKSYSQMLNEFRTTFLNIDMEVINELNDLFFNLW